MRVAFSAALIASLTLVPVSAAQSPPPGPPQTTPPPQLLIGGPTLRARGVVIPVSGRGAPPGAIVTLHRETATTSARIKQATVDEHGDVRIAYRPTRLLTSYRLRLTSPGVTPSSVLTVRTRDVSLAAFGDANFGDGVATVMNAQGVLWPWRDVAPLLRGSDIAFGNLECSISRRGSAIPKEFNFRGSPDALSQVVRFAGLDVLNLANNHVGDYGGLATLDTIRSVRQTGALPVGAGATLAAARRPQVIERLGLRVAFVGFSDIGPPSFAAGPSRPGTAFASLPAIWAGVRAARRRADVVIATFHWGIERDTAENARQRAFAHAALDAGATAVIGGHPHVLQPIRRPSHHSVIAYSLGNFVWAAGSAAASKTGVLVLHLSGRGVEGSRLLPARIVGTRPRLLRP